LPGRRGVGGIVVGDVEPTPSTHVDGVDLAVASVAARVGYLLAVGRVGSRKDSFGGARRVIVEVLLEAGDR
jgi:hypothetical protein